MRFRNFSTTSIICPILIAFLSLMPDFVSAQDKSKVEKALTYKPVQRNVEYDVPGTAEVESCRIEKTVDKFNTPGFVVYDSSGRILRLFFDTNRDNNLDSWSYFKDGIEVYRDIDSDFDGRADEFRWMGSAGIRAGKDLDKNGTIDRWLRISASELAEEVFQAARTSDAARFNKLLVSSSELKSLGLGEEMQQVVAEKLRTAAAKFDSFVEGQNDINSRSQWTQFGSTRPNLVPAGQEGGQQDLVIYDHAAAVFENGGKYGQLSLGTIVEVSPNNWRLLELPQIVGEGQVVKNGGLFYPTNAPSENTSRLADSGDNPTTKKMMQLFEQYDDIENQLKEASGDAKIAKLEQDRADLLMKLAENSSEKEEKANWIRQLADTVTSSYQSNRFPEGLNYLQNQIAKIEAAGLADQIPYFKWRMIYARFSVGHQQGDRRERAEASDRYIEDLEKFATDYPSSSFAADALFQLGLNSEVTEREEIDKAIGWYTQCEKSFPDTPFGKKAAGALTRLTSQGKKLQLAGSTLNGKPFNLQSSDLKGKIVIVHYWETWCDTCIEGFEELQRLSAKYKDKIQVIGANLDQESANVRKFLTENRAVNWPQLHSPGGVDKSPLAIQLGIATLPMTLLIDQSGNLVESNIPVDELDREIQRLIRRATGQANRSGTRR